jgi:hypothetical protein
MGHPADIVPSSLLPLFAIRSSPFARENLVPEQKKVGESLEQLQALLPQFYLAWKGDGTLTKKAGSQLHSCDLPAKGEWRIAALRRVGLRFLQELGPHASGVDFDESAGAGG